MVLRGLVKCLSISFIIFLMCPKRSRLSAPLGKQQEYYQAVRKSLNEVADSESIKLLPTPWSTDIIKQKDDLSIIGVDTEPGFDLSDDEIRNFKLWPKGIIPYYIDTLSFGDKVLRDRIRWYLREVNTLTKIRFLEMATPPRKSKFRWVFFINRQGQLDCADHSIRNYTNEGVQRVVLGYDCMSIGGELAEAVLSIAGIPPQHNSPDRDQHIEVSVENIIPEKRYLFEKLESNQWLFYDIKYDFSSGGHFHHHRYSRNGHATIEVLPPHSDISLGETNGFSSNDIKKLRMVYNYIVNKRENIPECDKLFRKGYNFNKQISSNIPEPKPRKKPHQYLGLPEKESIELNADSKIKSDGNDEKDNTEGSSELVPSSEEQEITTAKSNLKSSPNMEGRHAKIRKIHDPLTYLSDYQTGDERRRVGRNNKNIKIK